MAGRTLIVTSSSSAQWQSQGWLCDHRLPAITPMSKNPGTLFCQVRLLERSWNAVPSTKPVSTGSTDLGPSPLRLAIRTSNSTHAAPALAFDIYLDRMGVASPYLRRLSVEARLRSAAAGDCAGAKKSRNAVLSTNASRNAFPVKLSPVRTPSERILVLCTATWLL
jgi:hypothetical protein